jgi:competence protein ComGC
MHRRVTPLILLIGSILFSLPVAGFQQEPPAKQANRSKKSEPKGTASLTGCVDEQNGGYVLIHEQTRDLIANLEADGFPTEAFAKHLGHKVTVRGTSNPSGAHPVFKVRSVETISETCGSQHR